MSLTTLIQEFTILPADALCVVCKDVLLEPIRVIGCEHHMCKECLWKSTFAECPAEGCKCSPLQCEPSLGMANYISFLRCRCPTPGCAWFGNAGRLACHLNHHCLSLFYSPFCGEGGSSLNASASVPAPLPMSALSSSHSPSVEEMKIQVKSKFPLSLIGKVDLKEMNEVSEEHLIRLFHEHYPPNGPFIVLDPSNGSFDLASVQDYLSNVVYKATNILESLMSVPSDDKEQGGGVYQAIGIVSLPSVMTWVSENAKRRLKMPLLFVDIGCGLNWPSLFFTMMTGRPSVGIEIDCQRLFLASSAMLQLIKTGVTSNLHVGLFRGDATQPMNYTNFNVFLFWDRGKSSS